MSIISHAKRIDLYLGKHKKEYKFAQKKYNFIYLIKRTNWHETHSQKQCTEHYIDLLVSVLV